MEFYEIPALEGAKELLEQQRIKALWVELRDDNGLQVRDYLATFGYQCHVFDDWGKLYTPSQLRKQGDGLFLPASK